MFPTYAYCLEQQNGLTLNVPIVDWMSYSLSNYWSIMSRRGREIEKRSRQCDPLSPARAAKLCRSAGIPRPFFYAIFSKPMDTGMPHFSIGKP